MAAVSYFALQCEWHYLIKASMTSLATGSVANDNDCSTQPGRIMLDLLGWVCRLLFFCKCQAFNINWICSCGNTGSLEYHTST